jgi:3-phosphoshikimate 1-carboxyvinyltransferase
MEITVRKARDVDFRVTAPPSKSYTHRALIAAGLATGNSVIVNPLESVDCTITRNALTEMGVRIEPGGRGYLVSGTDGRLRCRDSLVLDMANSGTSLRLLASVALLCPGTVTLTGSERMKERPVAPLVEALNSMGASIRYLEKKGCPPIAIGGSYGGGRVAVDGRISSQFISSLLLAAPYAARDTEIVLPGQPSSRSYIDITIEVMEMFGADVSRMEYDRFSVRSGKPYIGREYRIEGDYSSASYFFAIAAVCGGKVVVDNLNPDSCQGDREFLSALEAMGAFVRYRRDAVMLEHDGVLEGIDIDMSSSPDTVQTLCMVAAFARSKTRITGIGHLRYKESDRLESIRQILSAMGTGVSVDESGITIVPGRMRGATVDPGDDHRTAMSAAVLGLGAGDVTIMNAECVGKSYPGFWDALREAGLV